jgi:SAM-dependent methyltransferase
MLIWLLARSAGRWSALYATAVIVAVCAAVAVNAPSKIGVNIWSPYYKIFYKFPAISVNEIGHQVMENATGLSNTNYHLPHVLRRDTGGRPFEDVLVIGAGSGNDVAHALLYGAKHVDAVEIDPSIIKIGRKYHPNQPYSDPRVHVINNDGRSYLHRTHKKYDLIVYGLVDSLTLMSNFSSVRLENYLFTKEAFQDVQNHLKPHGVFVMYNFFRWNWLTVRLYDMLEDVYGEQPILILLPPVKSITDKAETPVSMSVFMAGDIDTIREAFKIVGLYVIPANEYKAKYDFNGFRHPPKGRNLSVVYSTQVIEAAKQIIPMDNWPFVYLRHPSVPSQNIWGLLSVAALTILFVGLFTGYGGLRGISAHYFFLGGAFMLLETESIVKLALIHGSTWFVNSVVFASVLAMIFIANLWVLRWPVKKISVVYLLLFISLGLNYLIPVGLFLGKSWIVENGLSSLMMFLPIAFAGIIFASSFRRSKRPALDLGSNLLGVIAGGIAEYASLAFGYNVLLVFAAGMYLISLVALPRDNG